MAVVVLVFAGVAELLLDPITMLNGLQAKMAAINLATEVAAVLVVVVVFTAFSYCVEEVMLAIGAVARLAILLTLQM